MQGSDSAKSFLEILKSGGTANLSIDNSAPPDNNGIITRRVERQHVNEPLSAIGIKLSDDGEVLSVEPNSPAHKSNILPKYMIFNVNNEFVGARVDFEEIAIKHLTLIIKLQSTGAMSELLAKILDEEEKCVNDHTEIKIDTNELLNTTPRYGFLSVQHPLFLRWNHRLQTQREARQLLRQATRDAEEQQGKEVREMIRRAMEAEETQNQLKKEEKEQLQKENIQIIQNSFSDINKKREDEFLLRHIQDESSFAQNNENIELPEEINDKASPEELLKLIGAQAKEENILTPKIIIEEDTEVRFFIGPTEEYRLSDGRRVTISVKQRSGPLPKPPPGKPPKGVGLILANKVNAAVNSLKNNNNDVKCSFCYLTGHTEKDCVEKKEQDRKLALVPKERQICRDYLRGRCTRSDCMMKHVSNNNRSRSPRHRKRDRDRYRRSSDRHHRRESRRRRHKSRRRSQRSNSPDRYRRRR